MISDAVTSPYYDQATSWPRVLLCIIILLSVVLSPDIEKLGGNAVCGAAA